MLMIRRPTGPEPVNTITSISIDSDIASPTVSPRPVTTFSTPGGSPASCASSHMRSSDSDALSPGLITTELPQASAGPSFQAPIISGKFHGMIAPTTPTGSLWIMPRMPSGVGATSP